MKERLNYNNLLIKRDLETLCKLNSYINEFSNNDRNILFMSFMKYNNFILLEILDFLRKEYKVDIIKELEYKKQIKKIRAKLKANISNVKKIEETNEKMSLLFKNLNKKWIFKIFPFLCDNYAVFFYKNMCIINTFEINIIFEKIIYTNNEIDQIKIYEYSKEIGEIIAALCDLYKLNHPKLYKAAKTDNEISAKNFNLYLCKNKHDLEKILFFINKLSVLNFYITIVQPFFRSDINSLDIKLKYIICRNSYEELKEYEFNLDDKYIGLFYNKDFRNFMYHYSFPNDFSNIKNEKELYGVCEEILNIDENKLNALLNECMNELISKLSKIIYNSKYKYIIESKGSIIE